VATTKKTTLLIHLPVDLKAQLDALRAQGTTASGFVRYLLEREFSQHQPASKGKKGKV